VPQVLRELDGIKMRPHDLGKKADGVIRRIKEYARRGDSFVGVPINASLTMGEVASDPDMTGTLSWLQAGHGDDELLASVLDLRCLDLKTVVSLATRDRNLQNKARLARVAYLDVEEDLSGRCRKRASAASRPGCGPQAHRAHRKLCVEHCGRVVTVLVANRTSPSRAHDGCGCGMLAR
jgi:predicted ribonuclease YlaK